MQSAVQSGRREERVPLDALIELCADDGDEVLEADGLDLSPGGLAMRAAFVPPIGARLRCQFRCSPDGERVRAEGEVVWAEWESAHDGAFGMRFLELDTKSATAIRRYVEPDNDVLSEPGKASLLVTQLCIDGVGAPVEADVLHADPSCVVLEQELSFLRLGRGVSVDLEGKSRRGRIGSVELRQGPLDVPTLVFGILLDPEPELLPQRHERVESVRAHVPARARAAAAEYDANEHEAGYAAETGEQASQDFLEAAAFSALDAPFENAGMAQAPGASAITQIETESQPLLAQEAAISPSVAEPGSETEQASFDRAMRRAARSARIVEKTAVDARETDSESDAASAPLRASGSPLKPLFGLLISVWASACAMAAQLRGQLAAFTQGPWVKLTETLSVYIARVRLLFKTQGARIVKVQQAKRDAKRRTTAPAPRVQRSSVGAPRTDAPSAPGTRKGSRLLAVALSAVGIGLGVYTLAPRSGADRIRVSRTTAPSAPEATPEEPPFVDTAAAAPSEVAAQVSLTPEARPASEAQAAAAPIEPVLADAATAQRFGEEVVPHGRTFTLRMSGPVDGLEGERRDDGFTVRIPGRLALDRASPIATSHRAVARAMILNRGDYAELTVDFLPGLRPKYQVVGKDATIEVTLERL